MFNSSNKFAYYAGLSALWAGVLTFTGGLSWVAFVVVKHFYDRGDYPLVLIAAGMALTALALIFLSLIPGKEK